MTQRRDTVFTIGHSTHTLERFVSLLRQHGVTAVSDVRSVPASRVNPQFNREALVGSLKSRGIKYVFLGRELGGRSGDSLCYENGRVLYSRLARTEPFQNGLKRVVRGSQEHQIALMCAEKEPLECHRALLVSRELEAIGITVFHILASGDVESHRDSIQRLLGRQGFTDADLFRSRDDQINAAYAAQEQRIAYVNEELSAESE